MKKSLLIASTALGALTFGATASHAQFASANDISSVGQFYAGAQRGAALSNMEFARTLRRHVVIQPPTVGVPDSSNAMPMSSDAQPLFYGAEGDLGSTLIKNNGKFGADIIVPQAPAPAPMMMQDEPKPAFTPYTAYFGNNADYEANAGGSQYGQQFNTNGVIAGGNVDFGQYIPFIRLAQTGIAAGYSKTDFNAFGLPGGAQEENFHVGAYSTLDASYFDVASALSYGYTNAFEKRAGLFGVYGQSSDIHTIAFSAEASVNSLAFALPVPLAERLELSPIATFDYQQTFFEGGAEQGRIAGASVYDNDQANFTTGVGLKAGGQYNFAGNLIQVDGRVLYEHNFDDDGYQTFLSYAGQTAQVAGISGEDDRVAVGFSASTRIAEGVTASVRYDGSFAGDNTIQGYSGLVGFTF